MIVLVVGMHRSGTSTVAGLLDENRVPMGEAPVLLPPPGPENPRGFFENVRFRRLNDRIAERRGYRVKSWRAEIPACRPGWLQRRSMRRLLREYDARYPIWGFKDPRTCLTLDGWLGEIERTGGLSRARVVFTVRDPWAVARSLARRNGLPEADSLRLWRIYNERALTALDAWRPLVYTLRYEELCARPERVAEQLCAFVDAPVRGVRTRFVSASLDRSAAAARSAEVPVEDVVRATHERLLRRARQSRRLGGVA